LLAANGGINNAPGIPTYPLQQILQQVPVQSQAPLQVDMAQYHLAQYHLAMAMAAGLQPQGMPMVGGNTNAAPQLNPHATNEPPTNRESCFLECYPSLLAITR
jgi:hypothetical protein